MKSPMFEIVCFAVASVFLMMLSVIVILFCELATLQRSERDMRFRALACEAAHREWTHGD